MKPEKAIMTKPWDEGGEGGGRRRELLYRDLYAQIMG